MKKLTVYFLLFSFLTYSGCATLYEGTSEDITFETEPQGAKVLLNGLNVGITPVKLNFKKGKEYAIEFVKDGFETRAFRLSNSVDAGWIIADIILTLGIGIIVDLLTEAWYSFDYNYYKRTLVPKAESK